MDLLTKALTAADEASLTALANKGIYKRAVKDTDGAELVCRRGEDTAEVDIGGETVTVAVPLENCKCSCVSRTVCRHIIGAILLLKGSLTEEDYADAAVEEEEAPEEKAEEQTEAVQEEAPAPVLTDREIKAVNACASDCLRLLEDILRRGLVRLPDSAPEDLEAAAVRCHSLRMADAERMLRDLGGRLKSCLERRASFSPADAVHRLCRTAALLHGLTEDDITQDDLGVFRQSYDDTEGELTILPVGQRDVSGTGYEGSVYYFLDVTEGHETRFLTFSDLRPVFYDNKRRRSGGGAYPWGMTSPLSSMMRSRMTLRGARLSGSKLSSSQETHVVMHSPAVLDCEQLRSLIITDFRQTVTMLSEDSPESDRLFFIQPRRCTESGFDKYSQQYIMTVEDSAGNRVEVRAKYRAETKNFIALLESIGKKMLAEPQKIYTLLVSAAVEHGELALFPIEIYDFIRQADNDAAEPEEDKGGMYAASLLDLLEEVSGSMELVLQCGLQSGAADNRQIGNKCFNCGMKGLSRLADSFMTGAAAYRHSMQTDCRETLLSMAELEKYVYTAGKRLNTLSAIYNMKG